MEEMRQMIQNRAGKPAALSGLDGVSPATGSSLTVMDESLRNIESLANEAEQYLERVIHNQGNIESASLQLPADAPQVRCLSMNLRLRKLKVAGR